MAPTIDVLFEPVEGAILSGAAPFDPSRHYLLYPGDWISYLKHELEMPELFMYHHRIRDVFVACGWMVEPPEPCGAGGYHVELEIMSGPPDWNPPDRPEINYMKLRTAPVREQVTKAIRATREEEAAKRAAQDERAEEMRDKVRFLRQGGQENEANMLQYGLTPFTGQGEGGETLQNLNSELIDLAKRTD